MSYKANYKWVNILQIKSKGAKCYKIKHNVAHRFKGIPYGWYM